MSAVRTLILSWLLLMIFVVSCVDLKSVADTSISRDDSNLGKDNPVELKTPLPSETKDAKLALVGFSEGDIAPKFTLKTSNQSSVTSGQLLNEYEGLFILFYSDW